MFNLEQLKQIRAAELEELVGFLRPGSRVLELGAGTGEQARTLADRGFDVVAVDLANSAYAGERVWPVIDYDGRNIPLPDKSVDAIFSSNVLEHVEDLGTTLAEFARVLKRDGVEVHAMPTPSWRLWTFVAGVPTAAQAAALTILNLVRPPAQVSRGGALARNLKTMAGAIVPIGHGTSAEGVSELWRFSPRAWKRIFERHGHEVLDQRPMRLFYTGHMALGLRLSLNARKKLSRYIGSGTHIYVVRPVARSSVRPSTAR